jgi:glycosyltransferase involved in cell wall biosynthesis
MTSIGRQKDICFELISVIMPCFNGEKYLGYAIENVLSQTYWPVELIVINDGSTDGSRDIVKKFGERVILIEQENVGPGVARNRGISRSRGEFIAFLDADDYWRLDCLEKLHSALTSCDADVAYCGWQNIEVNGEVGKAYVPPDYASEDKREYFLRGGAPWPIHAALVRRKALVKTGGFDERLPFCEDYDLWLRLGLRGSLKRVNEVLAFYRHHREVRSDWKRGFEAIYGRMIKRDFVRCFREVTKGLEPEKLREFIDGALLQRGYQCFWQRELLSAQRIFRAVFWTGYWGWRDLKYLVPAFLPPSYYIMLIERGEKMPFHESA